MSSSSSSPTTRHRPLNLAPPPATSQPPTSPSRASSPRPPPPLHLTIRFSTSLPDLHLDILTPHQTTVAALKNLIRTRLSEPNAARRLRFIHGGKILPDASVLSSVLRAPPPGLSGEDDQGGYGGGGGGGGGGRGGKGKGVEGRAEESRVYVNCSIGDVLTAEEIEAEGKAAAAAAAAAAASASITPSPSPLPFGPSGRSAAGGGGGGLPSQHPSPVPVPRGFERLLNAGFTPAEVNQLRLQFRGIQAARHTPDTMPSPDTLRDMEDAWIDNNNSAGGAGVAGGGGGGGGGEWGEEVADDGQGMGALLDTLVKGMVVGFMFPLGSVGWLVREEGLWSRRWKVFAGFGVLLGCVIGLARTLTGEGR